jgi:hypothetical protein
VAVEHDHILGKLSSPPISEKDIPEKDRPPRVTSAIWLITSNYKSDLRRYNSGAIGSLTRSLLHHGQKYETRLSVFADGYSFRLVDLYNHPERYFK